MKKIETLTAAQEKSLAEYREYWLRQGRSCEPADRELASRVIREMYAALGKHMPYVWWCDGPAVGSLVRTILTATLGATLGANLRANLGANLRANLGANLGANLQANLEANLGANLGPPWGPTCGTPWRPTWLGDFGGNTKLLGRPFTLGPIFYDQC